MKRISKYPPSNLTEPKQSTKTHRTGFPSSSIKRVALHVCVCVRCVLGGEGLPEYLRCENAAMRSSPSESHATHMNFSSLPIVSHSEAESSQLYRDANVCACLCKRAHVNASCMCVDFYMAKSHVKESREHASVLSREQSV